MSKRREKGVDSVNIINIKEYHIRYIVIIFIKLK